MNLAEFRLRALSTLHALLDDKITALETALRALTEDAQNDSKSTAGDKHEVGRAMMQIEQEKIVKQLHDTIDQRTVLERVAAEASPAVIVNGSLVKTNRGYLLLAIAWGKMAVENIPVMVISPKSPLGQQLLGLRAGAKTSMNGIEYAVEET